MTTKPTASKASKATAPASKATPATKPTAVGPYRNNPAWHAAHGAAVAAHRGNPTARATLQVLTHLAWRGPAATVAWHKGTNAAMLAHAATLGVTPGQPVRDAVAACLAALPGHPTVAALRKATTAHNG